jgi:outer membrane protein OmpA-like peptidoglycan-associated protein
MSILNSLKDMATSQLISGVASHLGESNEGISKAMGGIFPSILGGLMGAKSEDHSMLSGLLSQAGNLGGGNLVGDLLGGLTGGNTNSGISGIGSSLISGLLGNKLGGAVDLISKFAGVKSSSSSSLMGIGGSLIASFLGKKMLGDNLNFSGILNMLKGEKSNIMAAAPAGFASTLGLGDLFADASSKVTNTVNTATSSVTNAASTITGGDDSNSGGGMKWLWPLLLLAGLALAATYLYKSCNKTEDAAASTEPATSTEPAVDPATTATVAATTDTPAVASTATVAPVAAVKESLKVKLKDGVEINAYKGGVESKLVSFLDDPAAKLNATDKSKDWFDFDNLNFDLGKSTITKESMVQVANLAAILKAYPALKIKVGGYTDKKGDDAANMKLSQSRADAVFAALKGKGANAAQLVKAEGYGETLATQAESASDEVRRADRRTAVRILEK